MKRSTGRINPASIIPQEVVSAVNGFVIKLMTDRGGAASAPNPNLFYKNYLATDENLAAGGTDYVFHKEGPIVYGYNIAADNTVKPFAYASADYANPTKRNDSCNLLIIAKGNQRYDQVVANYLTNFETFQSNAEILSDQAKALYTKLDGNRKEPGAVRKLFRSREKKPYVSTDTKLGKDKVYVGSDGGFYKKDGSGGYSILSQEDLGKVLTEIQNQNKEIFKTARVAPARPPRRVAFADPKDEYKQQPMAQTSAQQRSFSRPDDQRQQQQFTVPEPLYAPRTAAAAEYSQPRAKFSQPAQPRVQREQVERGLGNQLPQAQERAALIRTVPRVPSQQPQQPQQSQAQQRVPQQTFAAPAAVATQKLGAKCGVNKTESKREASGKMVNTFQITFTSVHFGSLAERIGLKAGDYLKVGTYRQKTDQEVLNDIRNFSVGTGEAYISSKLYRRGNDKPIDENFSIVQRIDELSSQREDEDSRTAQQQRFSAPISSGGQSFSLTETADRTPHQSSSQRFGQAPVDRKRVDSGAARSALETFATASQRHPLSLDGYGSELEGDEQLGFRAQGGGDLTSRRQIEQQGERVSTSQRRLPVSTQNPDSRVPMASRSMVSGGFASRPSESEEGLESWSLGLGDQIAQLTDPRNFLQRGTSSAQAGGDFVRRPRSSLQPHLAGTQSSKESGQLEVEQRLGITPVDLTEQQSITKSRSRAAETSRESPPPLPPFPDEEVLQKAGMTSAALPARAQQQPSIADDLSERGLTRDSLRMPASPSRRAPTLASSRPQDPQQYKASERRNVEPAQEFSTARARRTLLTAPTEREQSGKQYGRGGEQTTRGLQFVSGSAQNRQQRQPQAAVTTDGSHAPVAEQQTAGLQPLRPTAQQQKFETQRREDGAEQPQHPSSRHSAAPQHQFSAHSGSRALTQREGDTATHEQNRARDGVRRVPSTTVNPREQGRPISRAPSQESSHW